MEETLSQCSLFSLMNEKDQQKIAEIANSRHYQAGQRILNYGDIWPYLFLVLEGSVTAVKNFWEGEA